MTKGIAVGDGEGGYTTVEELRVVEGAFVELVGGVGSVTGDEELELDCVVVVVETGTAVLEMNSGTVTGRIVVETGALVEDMIGPGGDTVEVVEGDPVTAAEEEVEIIGP